MKTRHQAIRRCPYCGDQVQTCRRPECEEKREARVKALLASMVKVRVVFHEDGTLTTEKAT